MLYINCARAMPHRADTTCADARTPTLPSAIESVTNRFLLHHAMSRLRANVQREHSQEAASPAAPVVVLGSSIPH